MNETLARSSLRELGAGRRGQPRAARCAPSDRLGGHIVQGHVDGTGTVISARATTGSPGACGSRRRPRCCATWSQKGSITVDGVSLTVAELDSDSFTVSLIPETLERTNLGKAQAGTTVNLEVDVLAKYVEKLMRALGMSTVKAPFATIEEAIEDIRQGKMVVVATTRTARTRAT